MLDGPFWRIAILSLLLVLPAAAAKPPENHLEVAYSLGEQPLTDLGMDPTGQFVTAVVEVDSQKAVNNLVGTTHRDIYACSFGTVGSGRAGSGCRGLDHAAGTSTALGTEQVIDVTSTTSSSSGGIFGLYAIGGPGNTLGVWTTRSDSAVWEVTVGNSSVVLDVAIAPDGRRVAAAVAESELAATGRLLIYDGDPENDDDQRPLWSYALTDAQGAGVRPTSLDISRENGVLAVGTTNGVLFFDLDGARPTSSSPPGRLRDTGQVHAVALSEDGNTVAVAADRGVFFAPLQKSGSKVELESVYNVFHRQLPSAVRDVTLSLDGERFTAAAGSKIYFFERLHDANLASMTGTEFDAGTAIADVAADAKGRLVVAVAGTNVYGFGTNGNNTPIWSFSATQAGFGGLDGPLKRVAVSDGGDRFVVGGATTIMPYNNVVSADASLAVASGNETVLPAVERRLALTVTNTGSLPDNYTFVVERPNGWDGRNPSYVRLEPEQSAVVNFTVQPAEQESEGSFHVSVSVRSAKQFESGKPGAFVAGAGLNLTVPRAVSLRVELPEGPLEMRQGEERVVPVAIENVGNAGGLVNLTSRQDLSRGASWDIRFDREVVEIPAGSQADVTMRVTAPLTAGSGDRNIITVIASEGTNVASNDTITAYVDAQFGADLQADNTTLMFAPAEIRIVPIKVINRGNTEDTFNLTYVLSPQSVVNDWTVTIDRPQITIDRGATREVSVTIKPNVADPQAATLTLKTISQSDPAKGENSVVLSLHAKPKEPTEDDNLLPGPGPAALVGVLALAAFARRFRGGRE